MTQTDYSNILHQKWLEAQRKIDALEAENAHLRLQLSECKRIASEALDGEHSRYRAELTKIAQVRV